MTVVRPNSIAGINSITVQTGQALNIHDADGNLIRNITSSSGVSTFSSLHVGAGTTTSTQGISVGTGCSIVSTTVNQLELYTNSSQRLKITSGGLITQSNTWTNTYSATDTTHCGYQVHNISDTTDTYAALRLTTGSSSPATAQIASVRKGTGQNDLTFQVEASNTAKEALRITSAGLVGIGTDNIGGQRLELYNPTSAFDILSIRSGAGAYGQAGIAFGSNQTKNRQKATIFFQERTGGAHHAGDLCFSVDNAGGDAGTAGLAEERVRIQGSGHVGIGTSMPTDRAASSNTRILNVGIVTANTVYAAGFIPSDGNSNKKNLLDNGEFIVDQRMGGSATAITPTGGVDYTCDRWHSSNYGGEAGRITFQTVSGDVPNSNYRQSIKLDCTTAMGAPSGNNYMSFSTFTEAQDNRFLGHGTATAKPVTLQFWIKSTKTGTASVGLARHDASREYVAEYTISSSNTWEKKTITFPGDTSGTEMAMDNGRGFKLNFVLFAGSSRHATVNQWAAFTSSYYAASSNQVNLIDSTSNNIFFTGIQLEVGEVATPFEYRNYGDELLRCQRYYWKTKADNNIFFPGLGMADVDGNTVILNTQFPVTMRAAPTALEQSGTASDYKIRRSTTQTCSSVPTFGQATVDQVSTQFTKSSHGWGDGSTVRAMGGTTGAYLGWSAEL